MKRTATAQTGQGPTQPTSASTIAPDLLNQELSQNARIDALEAEVFRQAWLLETQQMLLDKFAQVLEKYANILEKLPLPRQRSTTEHSGLKPARNPLTKH